MTNKTSEIIESIRTPAGGFTRKGLESIGVSWPPKKGWKRKLIQEDALATDEADISTSNVIAFPETFKFSVPKDNEYQLVEVHMKTSDLKMLRDISIEKMKPLGEIIVELANKHGSDIERYIPPNMRD